MTTQTGRGLYREAYERDSCGFGLIASLDDKPSHWLVQTAIASLNRLTHRGAIATDGKTGDGCGLLLKTAREVPARAGQGRQDQAQPPALPPGLRVPESGCRAAPRPRAPRLKAQLEREGLALAGWRLRADQPGGLRRRGAQDPAAHRAAVRQLPQRRHRRGELQSQAVPGPPPRREAPCADDPMFYCPSLSASTIVYKGMVMPQHLAEFYPDLADPRLEASVAVFHQRFSTNTLPQWRLAHPFRLLAHNGEINTIEGNRQWAAGAWPGAALAGAAGTQRASCRWCRSPARTRRASTTCSRCC